MAVTALLDAVVFVDSHDFTTDVNQVSIDQNVAELDRSTFGGGGWRQIAPGVKDTSFSMSGFWQAGADSVDSQSFAELGTVDQVITAAHASTEGSVAYIMQGMKTTYSHGGSHGELNPFTLSASNSNGNGVQRGQLALAKGTVSATGAAGSGVQLGAVGATEYLYAAIHVFPTVGTTITIAVESDDNAGFTTPTSRGTIGPLTTVGGTWLVRVAGAITDDWFRLNVTAITGSFTAAGVIAVGS